MSSSTITFTKQQKAALQHRGNVAISAGAGSGKTRVLVEKYFNLLVDEHPEWPIESVVAITFTVKAASELRARILKRTLQELTAAKDEQRRTRLLELRQQISAAPIGTIHNFCSRVLREFAVEAGLDPDFSILETINEAALKTEAVEATLTEFSAKRGTTQYDALLLLSALYSRGALSRLLGQMLQRRAELLPVAERYVQEESDGVLAEIRSLHSSIVAERRQEVIEGYAASIALLEKCIGPKGCGDVSQAIVTWNSLVEQKAPWSTLCDEIGRAKKALFTQKDELRVAIGKSLCGNFEEVTARLLTVMNTACSGSLAELGDADRENAEILVLVSGLFLRAERHYRRLRSASSSAAGTDQLDFSDLELHTARLLNESVSARQRLRQRVRYMIIDEFQDTSDLQWNLLSRVVMTDSGELLPHRFFMVGDAKQSIYGFRFAGSRIFERVSELVKKSNAEVQSDGLFSMTTNFRTLCSPLASINALFDQLIGASDSAHQVKFEPLQAHRKGDEGCMEVLIVKGDDQTEAGESADDGDAATIAWPTAGKQARMIAQVIEETVAEGRYGYGDIAILFRKRKHFTEYEDVFRSVGIPFNTYRGKGLYEQPEVEDITAFLRFIADPADDRVLAQILRGALLNFPDELLLKISLFNGLMLWDKCREAFERRAVERNGVDIRLTPHEQARVGFAVDMIKRLESLSGFVPVAEVLQQVLRSTGAIAIFSASQRGMQAVANVLKFIDAARQLEQMDIEEFLEFTERQLADAHSEGEAVDEIGGAGVRLLTVHAAKGLEFPIVFLPQLDEKLTPRFSELVSDGQQWFGLSKTRSVAKEPVFLFSHLSEIESDKESAEERRVFYVAATRCQDRLYLCVEADANHESVWKWIGESSDAASAVADGRAVLTIDSSNGSSDGCEIPLRVMMVPDPQILHPESARLDMNSFWKAYRQNAVQLGVPVT